MIVPEVCWSAPGRVNLIGEHTDYNDGLAVPIAIPLAVTCRARTNQAQALDVVSRQQPGKGVEIRLADLPEALEDTPAWARYPLGIAAELRRRGYRMGGARLDIDGKVPLGAGLSSSAALCIAVATALRALFALPIGDRELIEIAQRVENEFVGAPTGILDQTASLWCAERQALLLDVREFAAGSPDAVRHLPFDLAGHGLRLLVVDTGRAHRHSDGGYARRREECRLAAHALGVCSLREAQVADLGRVGDPVLRRRARHVITENQRVMRVAEILSDQADPRTIGPVLSAGHRSLAEDFQVSTEALDTVVAAAEQAGAYGARMVGGGFGGSVLALADADRVEKVSSAVRTALVEQGTEPARILTVVAARGAHRIE